MSDVAITFRGAGDPIDDLGPLYMGLHDHHASVAPTLGPLDSLNDRTVSWERRRELYADWLAIPGAFVVCASDGDTLVGFSFVTITGGYQVWRSGDRIGEIKDLAVSPEVRGRGIGSLLLDATRARLADDGITEYRLNVAAANASAIGFYERHGMEITVHSMLGRTSDG